MQYTSEYWIEKLKLEKHPEGGYYSQSYKSLETVKDSELSVTFDGERPLATSIYFLLKAGEVSRFHRLVSDEIWYYHAGSSLTITCIEKGGRLAAKKLGLDMERGELPQVVIPAGTIYGAALGGDGYSLVGCMVSPGFDFADFELLNRDELLKQYPEHQEVIRLLT